MQCCGSIRRQIACGSGDARYWNLCQSERLGIVGRFTSPELGLRMQFEERIEAEVDGDSTKELRTTVAGGCFSEMLSALTAVTGAAGLP
jgi:hypothetical protein